MRVVSCLLLLSLATLLAASAQEQPASHGTAPVLLIHGGALVGLRPLSPEVERRVRAGMETALHRGYDALTRSGGNSLDAVETAIRSMEDSPVFNAGKGAVFTHEGRNELDASIMTGPDRRAGAVAGVMHVKNPISAARAVMEKSPHVLLVGEGADRFAASVGLEIVSPVYFWTPERWKLLQDELQAEEKKQQRTDRRELPGDHFGTVGAVALDAHGILAAGTSTGGTSNKRPGRVGDSPIIGAGTYADDRCAISATGHGEIFIRYAVAHDIAARVRYKGQSLSEAASEVLQALPDEPGGVGGVIALDKAGNIATPFKARGLFRGWIRDGQTHLAAMEK